MATDFDQNQKEVQSLLLAKVKEETRLKRIIESFKEEKENEDSWPGHEGKDFQELESQRDLVITRLELITQKLKAFGFKEKPPSR